MKWEYMDAHSSTAAGLDSTTIWYFNGQADKSASKLSHQDVLKMLGEQGWELVTVTESNTYYFKRPT
jgi:hypothetical protein